jgi:hypothetical protein
MNRVNSFEWGLVASSVAVACLCATLSTSGQKTDTVDTNHWKIGDAIRYENMTVFPVFANRLADTKGFVTLDQGLSAGEVVVTEKGTEVMRRSRDGRPIAHDQRGASVNELVLINRAAQPMILLAGELVSGGKQDRIISKDRIVLPGADPLPLDVFCVEAGRWSSGAQFSGGKLIVHPSVREKAVVDREQAKVWDAVRNGTTFAARGVARGGTPGPPPPSNQTSQAVLLSPEAVGRVMTSEAPTQSYKGIYESSHVENSVEPFVEEVQRRFARQTADLKGEFVVGAVVAYGSEVAWSDVFASSDLFERYWPKLLRSYVVEALARPHTKEQASIDDARVFLQTLVGHESIESEPGAYSLKQITQGRYVESELEALRPKVVSLHWLKIHRTS